MKPGEPRNRGGACSESRRLRPAGPAAEVLRVAEVDRPEPGPGEVRVRVHASGVNPTDVKTRSGATGRPIDGFQIPHHDGAGVIDAVGPGVPERPGRPARLGLAGRLRAALGHRRGMDGGPGAPGGAAARGRLLRAGGEPGSSRGHRLPQPVRGRAGAGCGGPRGRRGRRGRPLRGATWPSGAARPRSSPRPAARPRRSWPGRPGPGTWSTTPTRTLPSQIKSVAGPVDRIVEVALGANLGLDLAVSRPGTVVTSYAAHARRTRSCPCGPA